MSFFKKVEWTPYILKSQELREDGYGALERWILITDSFIESNDLETRYGNYAGGVRDTYVSEFLRHQSLSNHALKTGINKVGKPKMGDGGWDTYSLALLNQQCTQVIYTSLFLFKVMQIGAALHCERNKIPRMDFPSFVSYQEDFESMKILKGLEGRQYMKIFMRNDPVMAYSGHFQDVVNATNDDLITHAIQNLAIPYNLGQLTQKLGWECHSLLPWIKDNTNPINLTSFSF